MPAPSSTVWGNTITGSNSSYQGKIGIYLKTSVTATLVTVNVEVWFWSKYSVLDKNNSYYYNSNATTATSLIGSRTINHAVASGEGWSTSNQTKLGSAMYNYPRKKSAYDKRFAAKFTGIDILGASNAMTATSSVSIPALVSYSVKYNARRFKMNDVITALIAAGSSLLVGVLSLIGVIITNNRSNSKIQSDMKTAQAVTDEKINELTREVREHNNFARRMPVVEEQIKVINHRLSDLEKNQ